MARFSFILVGVLAVASKVALSSSVEPPQVEDEHRSLRFFSCPPKNFEARKTLDIDSYISKLWYPQKAAPVIYARGTSYCSVVQYTRDDDCKFLCGKKPRINVRNRGLDGSITGSLNDARLKASVPNPDRAPAKIRVGFPQRFVRRTNYWVIAAGTYVDVLAGNHTEATDEVYDWALISGGKPVRKSNGKCIAGRLGRFDTRGLWIFARDPLPPAGVVEAVEAIASDMGLDTSTMLTNVHEGCTYDFL